MTNRQEVASFCQSSTTFSVFGNSHSGADLANWEIGYGLLSGLHPQPASLMNNDPNLRDLNLGIARGR